MKELSFDDHEAIKQITNLIVKLRSDAKITINDLAGESGLSENTIKGISRKNSYPTLPVLIRICKVLELPLWEFFLLYEEKDGFECQRKRELYDSYERLPNKHKALLIYIARELSK
jgi:transcriptional regulator with XRE-family HTH domain